MSDPTSNPVGARGLLARFGSPSFIQQPVAFTANAGSATASQRPFQHFSQLVGADTSSSHRQLLKTYRTAVEQHLAQYKAALDSRLEDLRCKNDELDYLTSHKVRWPKIGNEEKKRLERRIEALTAEIAVTEDLYKADMKRWEGMSTQDLTLMATKDSANVDTSPPTPRRLVGSPSAPSAQIDVYDPQAIIAANDTASSDTHGAPRGDGDGQDNAESHQNKRVRVLANDLSSPPKKRARNSPSSPELVCSKVTLPISGSITSNGKADSMVNIEPWRTPPAHMPSSELSEIKMTEQM